MIYIYGTKDCVWCRRAQTLAIDKGLLYEYRHFSAFPDEWEWRQVPQIFFAYDGDDVHIGGYNEFKKWLEEKGI